MTVMVIALLVCVALSLVVLGLVAIPARREGRDLLTPRGERVVVKVRSGADAAATRTSSALSSANRKKSA
ncbi:hypothetical protein GCM10022199_24650 [Marihabitans asiaticum]|uniref:Uncharacterized protein n=1 Tax=Marihabitans asiaticum TaxID=415218 RepID=A0A560W9L2_9MICO|nr:hypothetical protein [Marihabitans asiaticum]TWD14314.1 hypothetical protein FB557_1723 [Marihabitans asiaticum]